MDIIEKEVLPFADPDLRDDCLETPWEIEARSIRLERKLFMQIQLIMEMNDLMNSYDQDFDNLLAEECKMKVDTTFIELHIRALHQELHVLSKYEDQEIKLSNNVNADILAYMEMQDQITETTNKIESLKIRTDELMEKEKLIEQEFYTAIVDNKFYKFLRRIFKKKYKPPKQHDPDGLYLRQLR